MEKLIDRIRALYPGLTSAKKKVASYILNNYNTIHFDTVTELAGKIGVSDTTIINFSMDAGFSGFWELKKAIRDDVQNQNTKIIQEADNNEFDSTIAALTRNMAADMVTNFTNKENTDAIAQAISVLEQANHIYFVGFYAASPAADEAALRLTCIGYRTEVIKPGIGDFIDRVNLSQKGDVAVVYDLANYVVALTEICSIFKKKEVPIILITDNGPSPRLEYADVIIRLTSEHSGPKVINASIISYFFATLMRRRNGDYKKYNTEIRDGILSSFNEYGIVERSVALMKWLGPYDIHGETNDSDISPQSP